MLDPLINTGHYPKIMEDILGAKLPNFTDFDRRTNKGNDHDTVHLFKNQSSERPVRSESLKL